jgi:hypothetical protein
MSREGILKYISPLLLPLEGPEICIHDRSIPIEILAKQHFNLIFSHQIFFSGFSSETAISVV